MNTTVISAGSSGMDETVIEFDLTLEKDDTDKMVE
jgi:hypothetical protein